MSTPNLSLGNLFRATQGTVRGVNQPVSMNAMNASAGTQASLRSFAITAVSATPPNFTYIVESTTETATFTFTSAGSLHGSRVGSVAANYSVTFNNSNFTVGSPTLGASPSFPIVPSAINASNYSEASAVLSMAYADGFNLGASGYNTTVTRTLYAVDVYNTINEPDFCLLFGTQIQLANGTTVNIEDLNVGDQIKAWVPAGLPDENQDPESDQVDWRFYHSEIISGSEQIVTVADLTFNFAAGYFSLNNGLINATETHPLYVWDNEIGKYKFKNVGDILIGDKLVMQDQSEVEVTNIELITEDVEIVTVNVEDADVYISNGLISHNKGPEGGRPNAFPSIPASGLRMYLDPAKSLSTSGTSTADWLDLSGWGTGLRPAGVANAAGITGGNPTYNNGASRKEKYWSLGTNTFWYKDGTTNINGGYTQFNTSEYTVVTWVRFASHPAQTWHNFFNKQTGTTSSDRLISLYINSNGSGTYYLHDGRIGVNSNTFSLSTGVWYMVSYTAKLNGTNVWYLDKTSQGSGGNGSADYTTSALITVGGNFREGQYYFNGQIGPVLFYNRQLSSTDIGQIYDHFSFTMK